MGFYPDEVMAQLKATHDAMEACRARQAAKSAFRRWWDNLTGRTDLEARAAWLAVQHGTTMEALMHAPADEINAAHCIEKGGTE